MGILLRGGLVATFDPPSVERADLRLEGETIAERGPALTPRPGETVLDCAGRLVIPGLVLAHTHLYSALARGMPAPPRAPRDFKEILELVWWRLDRALDMDSVRASGLVGAAEAAAAGVTTLIDHHASPSCIEGSLTVLADSVRAVGLRGAFCYEVTDRNGLAERDAGLRENERWIERADGRRTAGLVGAHAAFTLDDAALSRIADLSLSSGAPVHIHVAEDKIDSAAFTRLEDAGLVRERNVFAHGVFLSDDQMFRIFRAGAWLVHNPRSNMNNAVGYARVARMGPRVALGTDGIGADLFEEARAACFRSNEAKNGLGPTGALALLAGGHRLAGEIFAGQRFGVLAPGAPADVVVLRYDPPTPLTSENLAGHVIYGLSTRMVEHTIVAGELVLQSGRLVRVDEPGVALEGRKAAERLWKQL